MELSSHVDHAYQALAIDEQRKPFSPCIWIKQSNSVTQVLEQAPHSYECLSQAAIQRQVLNQL